MKIVFESILIIISVIIGYFYKKYFLSKSKPNESEEILSNDLVEEILKGETDSNSKILLVTDNFWIKNALDSRLNDNIVDIDDSENTFIKIINECTKTLNVIIDTNGGDVVANDKMIKGLLKLSKSKKVNTYIPYQAYSAGSMLALVGKIIYMGKCAIFTPIDPQLRVEMPNVEACTYSSDVIKKSHAMTKSPTFLDNIIYNEAIKYHDENVLNTKMILKQSNYNSKTIKQVQNEMCSGKYTHGKPFDFNDMKKMGIRVKNYIPKYIDSIMNNIYEYKKLFN